MNEWVQRFTYQAPEVGMAHTSTRSGRDYSRIPVRLGPHKPSPVVARVNAAAEDEVIDGLLHALTRVGSVLYGVLTCSRCAGMGRVRVRHADGSEERRDCTCRAEAESVLDATSRFMGDVESGIRRDS